MPIRSTRTRANSKPTGAPTTSASRKPVRKSSADSNSWLMKLPRVISCHSRTSVSENGTMKARLVERPAISQMARPARTLSSTGLWRRTAPAAGRPRHARRGGARARPDEIAARDQLPQPHQRLRERHHEGAAGRAPGDLPDGEAGEDAEQHGAVAADGSGRGPPAARASRRGAGAA